MLGKHPFDDKRIFGWHATFVDQGARKLHVLYSTLTGAKLSSRPGVVASEVTGVTPNKQQQTSESSHHILRARALAVVVPTENSMTYGTKVTRSRERVGRKCQDFIR